MDWASYGWGVATLPILALVLLLLFLVGLELFGRVENRGVKCDRCDWRFAGLDENYGRLGSVPDEELNHPTYVHAHLSALWHDQVVTRTSRHREAWTLWFDALSPSSSIRERYLPYSKRMGVRGRTYD